MGYSNWNDEFYRDQQAAKTRAGRSTFDYHDSVKSKPKAEQRCHPTLDPKGVTRESRDSDIHPESIAIAVILDQTGSMASVPRVIQAALPELMGSLIGGGVRDPQVLFGAIGDESNGEAASLQIGQFESGVEMDADITNLYLEGQGGGSGEESYQNALYFLATHTSCDCFEKRGKKGYAFFIGDERPYPFAYRAQVERLIGDKLEADIPIGEVVRMAKERWHIYFVIPAGASHARSPTLHAVWRELLDGPEHVIDLDDATQICGCITRTVIKGETGEEPATGPEPAVIRI